MDIENQKLLDDLHTIRSASEDDGLVGNYPALPDEHISWLTEAGFEFAVKVFQDWDVSLILARKPD